jgi:hypothetical protein
LHGVAECALLLAAGAADLVIEARSHLFGYHVVRHIETRKISKDFESFGCYTLVFWKRSLEFQKSKFRSAQVQTAAIFFFFPLELGHNLDPFDI